MAAALDLALATALSAALDAALAGGMAPEPVAHARQVAAVASALWRAFGSVGVECVLVGGSAIEVHAPGIYVSGDVDVVLDGGGRAGVRETAGAVFAALGFARVGRHWTRGDLFLEVPGTVLDDPTDVMHEGDLRFRVARKEVLLRDRLVGFMHWRHTAYGEQAAAMLAAFGDAVDELWLAKELRREGALAALDGLRTLVASGAPVDERTLDDLLERLHERPLP